MQGFKYSEKFKTLIAQWYPRDLNPKLWEHIDAGNIKTVGAALNGYMPTLSIDDFLNVTSMAELEILKNQHSRDKEIMHLYELWLFEVSDYVNMV